MDTSRFRFTDCQGSRPDQCVLGVMPSGAIWDSNNVISSNGHFVAIPWALAGSAAVLKCGTYGKLPNAIPLVRGQGGAIIETAFDPFDPNLLMTASEDGSIRGYSIPTDGLTENLETAQVTLIGHSRKCGIFAFHPSARGVLASAGTDKLVHIWDVANETAKYSVDKHAEYVTGLDWNLDGSLLCSTGRNKTVNVIDPRTQQISLSSLAHQSARTQRCIWAKRQDKILTFGWSSTMQRQIKIWDPRTMQEAADTYIVDQSGSLMMPIFDEDLSLLYVGSRGEGSVKCFELTGKGILPSFEHSAFDPLRGLCAVPKFNLDVKRSEIGKLYTLTSQNLSAVNLVAPRRNAESSFQADLFPPTFSTSAVLTADQYFSGKNSCPAETSLEYIFNGTVAPPQATPAAEVPESESQPKQSDSGAKQLRESSRTRHVDPAVDVDPSSSKKKEEVALTEARSSATRCNDRSEVERLLSTFRAQKIAVDALRQELSAKESEMSQTLEELEKALNA